MGSIGSSYHVTGRVSALALHPENPSVIWAGGAQGGVWRTDDAGNTWKPLTDQECSLSMGAIAVDPKDPEIVYAGTGEAKHGILNTLYVCGVLRSSDSGNTWTQLGESVFTDDLGGAAFSRILIDNQTAGTLDATTVWAATTLGLYRSTDSGTTWTQVVEGFVSDLISDASAPGVTLFATISPSWRSSVGGVNFAGNPVLYRSDDGGLTWTDQQSFTGYRAQMAQSNSDPDVLYVASGRWHSPVGMARSVDHGVTWTAVAAAGTECRQCGYNMDIAVHPGDPDIVYFGAVVLYRSVDAGATFEGIMNGIYVDQHVLTVDPRDPDLLLVGNDGGVYRSRNRGDSWEGLNADLSLTQFYPGLSIDPQSGSVLGGTQDQGTVYGPRAGGYVWDKVLGGDGGYTAIHPVRDQRWATAQWARGPLRSDGGGRFLLSNNGIDPGETTGRFYGGVLVMDPFDPSVLYYGRERLYRSRNGGNEWTPVGDAWGSRVAVDVIAPARSDRDVVYVGTVSLVDVETGVFVTRDGGVSWTDISAQITGRHLTDLAVHPSDPGTAYATFSHFTYPHVFVTRDYGASWTDITGNLPDHPVNSVLLDPVDPDVVYIGTDLGVFVRSRNGFWGRFGTGLPMSTVFDLVVDGNAGIMVAGTYGRGAFAVPVEIPLSLELRGARQDVTLPWRGEPASGSTLARIYGTGWPSAQWSADDTGAPWLKPVTQTGQSLDSVAWRIEPASLNVGKYRDSILVTVPGAPPERGSSAIPVTLEILPTETIVLGAHGRYADLPQGGEITLADSVSVTIEGPRAVDADWTVSKGSAGWLHLATTAGSGQGVIRWTRDAGNRDVGLYVDTIRVAGPGMLPVTLVDSLEVMKPTSVAASDSLLSPAQSLAGVKETLVDSLLIELDGWRAGTATWTATNSGSAWLTLDSANGKSGDRLFLHRNVATLDVGTHIDTVRIEIEGQPQVVAIVVDTLEIGQPVTVGGAAAALLDGVELDAIQILVLDRLGNGNGSYDLGDVLSWIARCRGGDAVCEPAATGSVPTSDSPVQRHRFNNPIG